MKVMLISSPFMDLFSGVKNLVAETFPLGLGYIASYLRENGHQIIFIDSEAMKLDYEDIAKRIRQEQPGIVGISAMTSNFPNAVKLAKLVKENSDAITIIGGIHASSIPLETIRDAPDFDILVYGEGEKTMLELCNEYDKNKNPDLSKINGICFRIGKKVIKNPPRELIRNIDELPFPARDLVDLDSYQTQKYLDFGKKFTTMRTSRGCPNRCTFCSAHLSMGYEFRPHSPEYAVSEIEHVINEYGIEFIFFYDDTFTIDRERVVKICNLIIKKKLKFEWCCFIRVNTVDEDLLRLMKKAGLKVVGFGVESGNQNILNLIKKGITLSQVRDTMKIIKKLKLKSFGSFMIGLPGETKETIENTINFAIEIDPDNAFFFILTPFPGSEIYNQYKGILFSVSNNWLDYKYVLNDKGMALDSKQFTKEELKNYLISANRRFYFRPSHIIGQLLKIRSIKEFKANIEGGFTLFKQTLAIKSK